jgi:serine-type D-Ala-D-Ala carboxypeptidase (penicillin-binding protein 5/6)
VRWLVAACAAAAALTGCGGVVAQGGVPPSVDQGAPLQAANGPLQAQRRPLQVDLAPSRDPVTLRFGKPPAAGLLFDLDTGEVLWRRDALTPRPIASLTKMMTAVLAVEALEARRPVPFTRAAAHVDGSRVGMFRPGRRVRAETLLWGTMLSSGNDAATALAQGASGSLPAFVGAMNARARELGLACTQFRTPHGLSAGDRSCPADLAALARAVLDEPRLARIVRRRDVALPYATKGGRLHLSNTNPLLRTGFPGTLGIKTGYTRRAGRCLVAAVRQDGRRLGLVLLDSPDPGRQARALFNRAARVARTPG